MKKLLKKYDIIIVGNGSIGVLSAFLLKIKHPKKKIALLGNSTNFQLKEILELELRESGISIEIDLGDYDLILQDSVIFRNYDAVIIFWELSNLIDGFNYKYNSLSEQKLDSLVNKVESEIKLSLENLKDTQS